MSMEKVVSSLKLTPEEKLSWALYYEKERQITVLADSIRKKMGENTIT